MSEIPFKGEIRRDYITGSDVIFTFSRDIRPKDFKNEEIIYQNTDNCPFEYGKEPLNTTIKFVGKPWKLRLMYNKYPVVNEEIKPYIHKGFFTDYANYGKSYVVIDTPHHTQKFYDIDDETLQQWFELLVEAEKKCYSDKNIKHVYVFKNSGSISGGSLHHPHTQIIGFTFVLPVIKQELRIIEKNNGGCILEEAIPNEKERMLLEDENAISFAPYGSMFKGMSVLLPKRHLNFIGKLKKEEIKSLIKFMKEILRKNERIFGGHSYNITFHETKTNDKFHFYIEIAPRFSNFGAMELSGVYLNSLRPEEYATKFKQID
ncbi:DUF4931 domain-containing protein [Candidatus Parvarchaeota archaeon]|jgi:UDPglucose--hexose-1-phosphate uridylyltransferase|nr:DUF4931 domain-containing protein [Candidatus Parvarchaeota archaeon]